MMPQVTSLMDQPFIMVPNPNYVPASTAMLPPPTGQQPASTVTPPPEMDATTPESSHRSKAIADAPPPPPIVQLRIWPDSSTTLVSHLVSCISCL
ncbi:uncharacterized protein DS421_14g462580 [Arachis hypogaea]|nr:uncharacterized protein DS421_14g462580 [Arachis hypogaea]